MGGLLSKRLEEAASFADPGCAAADVGCDHAYIPIELIRRGICARAWALDINEMPLKRARDNAREFGVEGKMEFLLSDGLKEMPENCVDTVIISGMGGELIASILTDAPDKVLRGVKKFILSPNSKEEILRRVIWDELGWEIYDESLVMEGGKYYYVMDVRPEAKNPVPPHRCPRSEFEYRYGWILPYKGNKKDNILDYGTDQTALHSDDLTRNHSEDINEAGEAGYNDNGREHGCESVFCSKIEKDREHLVRLISSGKLPRKRREEMERMLGEIRAWSRG